MKNSKFSFHVVVICLVLALTGCSRQTAAPLVVPVHDTLYRNSVQYDTSFVDRWHYIDRKGDTVWMRDSVTVYRARYIHDTTREVQTLTVQVPMVKTEYVEKPLSGVQKLCLMVGMLFLIVAALWLLYKGYMLWRKR